MCFRVLIVWVSTIQRCRALKWEMNDAIIRLWVAKLFFKMKFYYFNNKTIDINNHFLICINITYIIFLKLIRTIIYLLPYKRLTWDTFFHKNRNKKSKKYFFQILKTIRGCLKSGPKDLSINQICHPMGSAPFPFRCECPKLPARRLTWDTLFKHFFYSLFQALLFKLHR